MKRLTDSFIFSLQSDATNNKVKNSILNLKLDSVQLSIEQVERQLDILKRKFKYVSTLPIINYTLNGSIIPIYSKSEELIENISSIMSWPVQIGTEISCIANFAPFRDIVLDNENNLEGDSRLIFSILQSSLLNLIVINNWKGICNNYTLLKDMASAYAKMLNKVLDKMFSIKSDEKVFQRLAYLNAIFFLHNIMQIDKIDTIQSIASSVIEKNADKNYIVNSIDIDFKNFEDIRTYLLYIKDLEGMLSQLQFRSVVFNWINTYSNSATLALDYLPAFLWSIGGAYVSSRINNSFMIESLLKGKEEKIITSLVKYA